jgi:SAM-dependent methyltransferase
MIAVERGTMSEKPRMGQRLRDIATRFSDANNPDTKLTAGRHYDLYDRYFGDLAESPVTLLELGVLSGESLKTFATYFRNGHIIGLDIENREVDYSDHPNITFVLGDQKKQAHLAEICAAKAPLGLDIVIDDASHLGAWSLTSYRALFPRLKSGGLYIVEDWGTGYWQNWPDGSAFDQTPLSFEEGQVLKRIPSHDFGMAGFIKYLVDDVIGVRERPDAAGGSGLDRLEWMHVHRELVVLKKA